MTIQVGGWTAYDVTPDYGDNLSAYRAYTEAGYGFSCHGYPEGLGIQACLPHGKIDVNVDPIGINHTYPTASQEEREAIEEKLHDFTLGFLHYLRTELGYSELGLSLDDYDDSAHFPPRSYVREGRRMIGEYIFTEHDALRPRPQPDSVSVGDYPADSHCVTGLQGQCEGAFYLGATRPYQIPYGVIVPKRIDGLLVPMAVSASHVGYGTLRMEPVRMSLGQAAGSAAVIALESAGQPRDIDVGEMQRRLTRQGVLIDVPMAVEAE